MINVIFLSLVLSLSTLACRSAASGQESTPASTDSKSKTKSANWTHAEIPVFTELKLEQKKYLIAGGTLLTARGETIRDGHLLIAGGLIKTISRTPIQPPPGTIRIDAKGKFVTPGLIDTHSHLGVYPVPSVRPHRDGNEATSPITADVRAEDAIWPQDPGFERALAGGVTTLQILPGSANLIGGAGVTVKNHPARSSRAMVFPGAPRGLKMACGENPKRVYGGKGRRPSTRMGSQALWRATFTKALAYRDKRAKYEAALAKWNKAEKPDPTKKPSQPGRDFISETLLAAIDGDILVHVHCYRADEMIRVLELAREYNFRVRSFHHAVEAYKIRDVLAREKVGVSTWADWWGFKLEAFDAVPQNAALVGEAGARAIIHSDSPLDVQRLNQEAAKAYWSGRHKDVMIDENEALRWITANPAWALGIDGRTGTLTAGKMADVVIWSQHPFSVYAKADRVFVDGVLEYDSSAKQTKRPWSDFEAEPQ